MTKLEMVQEAVAHLGEAPAAELAAFVRQRHGVKVEPAMVPIIRASLREKEFLAKAREQSKVLAEQLQAAKPKPKAPKAG